VGWGWSATLPVTVASVAPPTTLSSPVPVGGAEQTQTERDALSEPAYRAAPAQTYRYYCPDSGYYPSVRTCPAGWLRVVPDGAPGP
jgi:hypothetical protein